MKFIAIVFLSCIAYAASSCLSTVTLTPGNCGGCGGYYNATHSYNIYDINIWNNGSCPFDSVTLQFTLPTNFSIAHPQASGLNPIGNNKYVINATAFANAYSPTNTFFFSIQFIYPSVGTQDSLAASVKLVETQCGSCLPPPSSSCSASASLVARSNAQWSDQYYNYTIYDVTIVNTGRCPLDAVGLQSQFANEIYINAAWNIERDGGNFFLIGSTTVNSYPYAFIPVGGQSTGQAGLILQYFSDPLAYPPGYKQTASVSVYGTACAASCSA